METKLDTQIRWLIRSDMDEVLRCDWTAYRQPWGHEDYISHLRQRNCIGMVAVHNEMVVGVMMYELHKSSMRILRFCTHAEWQRCGVGAAMMRRLIGKLSEQRRRKIVVELPDDNLAGHLFLRSQGFVATEIERGDECDTYKFVYILDVPVAENAGLTH